VPKTHFDGNSLRYLGDYRYIPPELRTNATVTPFSVRFPGSAVREDRNIRRQRFPNPHPETMLRLVQGARGVQLSRGTESRSSTPGRPPHHIMNRFGLEPNEKARIRIFSEKCRTNEKSPKITCRTISQNPPIRSRQNRRRGKPQTLQALDVFSHR